MTLTTPDYIGHSEALEALGIFDISGTQEWGMRKIGGQSQDVDGYKLERHARMAMHLAPAYGLPPQELVKRVNGVWCNVW